MRPAPAFLLLLVMACASSAPVAKQTLSPPTAVSIPPTAAPSPSPVPLKILTYSVAPYPGESAMGKGTILILSTGYILTFDADHLTPGAVGGQVINLHVGTCAGPDLTSNQLVGTVLPDDTGKAHLEVTYPTPYALPAEGRVITIHGAGFYRYDHLACGATPFALTTTFRAAARNRR